jgi:Asp-tRNA(Asn)/Glu-tRNA(Gln) amidotransferase A subunit family amidase
LRIGILKEGFAGTDAGVSVLVMAAADVLVAQGAQMSKVSIPEHFTARTAQMALWTEGGRAVFQTGFYGAFSKSYYPASLLAAVNKLWAHQTKAFDAALADVDAPAMPTCLEPAPAYKAPATYPMPWRTTSTPAARNAVFNTQPYNYTGHPALAVPVGKVGGLPASMQLVGWFFEDPPVAAGRLLLSALCRLGRHHPRGDLIGAAIRIHLGARWPHRHGLECGRLLAGGRPFSHRHGLPYLIAVIMLGGVILVGHFS